MNQPIPTCPCWPTVDAERVMELKSAITTHPTFSSSKWLEKFGWMPEAHLISTKRGQLTAPIHLSMFFSTVYLLPDLAY